MPLTTPNSKRAVHGLRIASRHMAGTFDWYTFVRPKYFSFHIILFLLSVDILHSQNTKIVAFTKLYRLSNRLTEVYNNYPAVPHVHHYDQFSNHPLVISTAVQRRTEGLNWIRMTDVSKLSTKRLILPSSSL